MDGQGTSALADAHKPRSNTMDTETSQGETGRSSRPVIHSNVPNTPETPDAFDTARKEDGDEPADPPRASVDLEELPIELISLTDSFIDSLSAKSFSAPPSIDNVSRLFQEFYTLASTHINTHIASLASRQNRDKSPAPSLASRTSSTSLLRVTLGGGKDKAKAAPKNEPEQQMITAEELANRKKARKALEQKRGVLEEAVERRLCEGVYTKLYRHRSTQDEAQDDKLRSKTTALGIVGIGPADLGVDLGGGTAQTPEEAAKRLDQVREWLEPARKELVQMTEAQYPLGKLNHLKAAHKAIVDTLAHFHPSSSADEIMPMLIYTLITLPPEKLHVISDLNFVQRFRWEPKLFGEAAYCLTNLEATISFLETVDLSTLRADEAPSGPSKPPGGSGQSSPKADTFPPAYVQGSSGPLDDAAPEDDNATPLKPVPASSNSMRSAAELRNRRLSDLLQTPAQAMGAASDAVLSTADQGFKNIGNSLGDSYKFLVGKLKEKEHTPGGTGTDNLVPKTLEDARKLVGTPPLEDDASCNSSLMGPDEPEAQRPRATSRDNDKMLHLVTGRRLTRDHSADSTRSAGSTRKSLFADGKPDGSPVASQANPAIMDQMRNLGNTLNPMAKFGGFGMMRGFGRTTSSPSTPTVKDVAKDAAKDANKDAKDAKEDKDVAGNEVTDGGDLGSAFPDIAAALPAKDLSKIHGPNKRFMEMENAGDLRLNEVMDLLRDYRRLAGALKDRDAFKE